VNRPLGCLVLLLAPVLIYGAWVSYPPSRYEAMSAKVLSDGAARHAEEQKYARRPDHNAYIDPDFLPFWGREGIEKRDPSPAGEQLKVLDGLCDLYEGKDVGLEKRFRESAIRKRFEKFQQYYPRIHKLCQLPDFVAPLNQPGDLLTDPMELVALRRLPMYLSGYAEYLAVQGKNSEALAVAMDSLRFARLVNHQQFTLLRSMIGLAVQHISQSTLAMLLDNSRAGVPLEKLMQTLQATHLPATAFGQCLESEYCQAMNSLGSLSKNQSFSWIPSPPGLESREFRLYKNDFMEMLHQVRQGQPIQSGWSAGFGSADWLLGRHRPFCTSSSGFSNSAGRTDAFPPIWSNCEPQAINLWMD